MANFNINLSERELEYLTELMSDGIANYQRLLELDKATGRTTRMKKEYVDSYNFQLNLYTKLIKITNE